ncbi:Ppx/GppA family phosphatase [Gottfriedia acidiceleris]|uniref:Ppx/GppA family phosphatase n=1 Tax=Gottfriedia acidiceleris TaxID=371036 RepID=UPI000B42F507|nr:Ppx/GppA family phosphatase [Gottfriedia acidiceleris]
MRSLREKYGIIDIGSNTMRLVIYEQSKNGRIKEVENIKSVARLRKYLNDKEILNNEGKDVLLKTLLMFQDITRYHKIIEVKCVATATIRQAGNQEEIIQLVAEKTDFTLQVLSGYEEAFYGFLAVVNSMPIQEGVTIDIGGGSTEVTYFKNREMIHFHSFPFGVLSLKQDFISSNIPTDEEMKELTQFLQKQFRSLDWLVEKQVPIIALGGSARNVAQIHQSLVNYPILGIHQYEMNYEEIDFIKKHLSGLSYDQILRIEGLSKDRADIILPAIEAFKEIYSIVHAKGFLLSSKGLRDGFFMEELVLKGEILLPNIVDKSFSDLEKDYEINLNHVNHMKILINQLVEQINLYKLNQIMPEDSLDLNLAARVFNIGKYIDEDSSSQHTFYLLANRTIEGLGHKNRIKIALIASYKNKNSFKQFIKPFLEWFTSDELKKIRFLGILLKFVNSLNASKREAVKNIEFKVSGEDIIVQFKCIEDSTVEEIEAEKHKKQLEKIFNKTIHINFETHKSE